MPRVVHFEFAADDPERAADFYRAALGWEVNNWGGPIPYWLATTGPDSEPGINGAIAPRQPEWPSVVCTIGVADLTESVGRVLAAGGSVIEARMPIPGIGYMAYCRDTEGNVIGLMQSDPTAH